MRLAEDNVPKKKWTVGSAKNRPLTPSPIADPRSLLHPSIVAKPPPPKPHTPPPQTHPNTLAEYFPYLTLYTWRSKNNIPYHCLPCFLPCQMISIIVAYKLPSAIHPCNVLHVVTLTSTRFHHQLFWLCPLHYHHCRLFVISHCSFRI